MMHTGFVPLIEYF